MPKSVYLICSQSGSEDQLTGLVSLFSIYERVQIVRRPKGGESQGNPVERLPCRITAVWEREPDDPLEDEYVATFLLHVPEDPTPRVITSATFQFGSMFQRLSAFTHLGLYLNEPGLYRIESRVVTVNGAEFRSTQFPIIVDDNTPTGE